MTDIELIREAADWICPEYRLNCAAEESKSRELRALADRLDAQSKAEPSALMAEDGRLCSPATKKCAMHKSTAEQFNIPLFSRADAGEVEMLKAGLTDARRTGDYWKMELVAANKEITELESQLSAIRQAVDVANPSDSRHYHDCVLLFKADWKAILSAVKDAPAQQPENRKCVFCNWSGTLEYLTVTPEGEFLCPKCHDRTVQQPEQGSEK